MSEVQVGKSSDQNMFGFFLILDINNCIQTLLNTLSSGDLHKLFATQWNTEIVVSYNLTNYFGETY